MSETSQGQGWWEASDGLWYPPESHADPTRQAQSAATMQVNVTMAAGAPGLPPGVTPTSPWMRLASWAFESVLFVLTLGIGWLIWAAVIGGIGQTPAKKLLGLRVIKADTMRPAGLATMFWLRGLLAGFVVQFAVIFTLGIILFMPFWDKRNQNLWDKISTTYVVNDPSDAWNTRPGLV
ncbi:MAG: RDD family protein [Acidimicrobiales bacterium]